MVSAYIFFRFNKRGYQLQITSAEVNSEATLKIVASEDVLIGVPENCVIDSIELELGENNYYDKIWKRDN